MANQQNLREFLHEPVSFVFALFCDKSRILHSVIKDRRFVKIINKRNYTLIFRVFFRNAAHQNYLPQFQDALPFHVVLK